MVKPAKYAQSSGRIPSPVPHKLVWQHTSVTSVLGRYRPTYIKFQTKKYETLSQKRVGCKQYKTPVVPLEAHRYCKFFLYQTPLLLLVNLKRKFTMSIGGAHL